MLLKRERRGRDAAHDRPLARGVVVLVLEPRRQEAVHERPRLDPHHPLADGASEVIDLPIGPDDKRSGRQRVAHDGKPARTRISVEQRFRGYTWMRCCPLTGRTHQIRVHLASVGFPLAVDPSYGRHDALYLSALKAGYKAKRGQPERPLIRRLTLHSAIVRIPPLLVDAEAREVEAPLPKDLSNVLKQLGKVRSFGA